MSCAPKVAMVLRRLWLTSLAFAGCSVFQSQQDGPIYVTNIANVQMGASAQPTAVVKAADGSFLIVGSISATRQAFAMNLTDEGSVNWLYRRDAPESDRASTYALGIAPVYYDAFDWMGRHVLCGAQYRPHGFPSPPLLTVLDSSGRVVDDRFVEPDAGFATPEIFSGPHSPGARPVDMLNLARIYKCSMWGDDVLLIGAIEDHLWITLLDSKLAIKWQRLVRWKAGLPDASVAFDGLGLGLQDEQATISVANSRVTEVVSVTRDGVASVDAVLPGKYILLTPSSDQEAAWQFIGGTYEPVCSARLISIGKRDGAITYSDPLVSARRSYPYQGFTFSDGSIALLGSSGCAIQNYKRPEIMRFSPASDTATSSVVGSRVGFLGGSIHAAAFDRPSEREIIFATSFTPITEGASAYGLSINKAKF